MIQQNTSVIILVNFILLEDLTCLQCRALLLEWQGQYF